ncbi:hypothetical protein CI109_101379 [Kwoniella shandongensis]|uniref:Uncharacterized protein n=1 Tax=Kwoniella shandongensis TaxID=1734106 RepID=A0A5M6BYH7_9TREE|nr:uncharacterized protein CI109_005077 [Kwoniella shandongensis]KAA5526505.1 hypothetical protein CI109_005077 [Kwoniella shandongensis]
MQPPPVPRPTATGKLISTARVFVKKGKEARMKELIVAIRREAEASESGTLTYRATQALGTDGEFLIFEEYVDERALAHHYKGEAFTAMGEILQNEDILDVERGGVIIDYFEEF